MSEIGHDSFQNGQHSMPETPVKKYLLGNLISQRAEELVKHGSSP